MSDVLESTFEALFLYGCFFALGATAGCLTAHPPDGTKDLRPLKSQVLATASLCNSREGEFVVFEAAGSNRWVYSVRSAGYVEHLSEGSRCSQLPIEATRASREAPTLPLQRSDEAGAAAKGLAVSPITKWFRILSGFSAGRRFAGWEHSLDNRKHQQQLLNLADMKDFVEQAYLRGSIVQVTKECDPRSFHGSERLRFWNSLLGSRACYQHLREAIRRHSPDSLDAINGFRARFRRANPVNPELLTDFRKVSRWVGGRGILEGLAAFTPTAPSSELTPVEDSICRPSADVELAGNGCHAPAVLVTLLENLRDQPASAP